MNESDGSRNPLLHGLFEKLKLPLHCKRNILSLIRPFLWTILEAFIFREPFDGRYASHNQNLRILPCFDANRSFICQSCSIICSNCGLAFGVFSER